MNGYDNLGYGTHLILDGFRADAARLTDDAAIAAALEAVLGLMGETGAAGVLLRHDRDGAAGASAAIVGAEAHACLHAFPALRKLSLDAFSARSLPSQAVTEAFLQRFAVGRYESRVHGRGRLLPPGHEGIERALDGDRDYARLRLRDLLGA